jgi:TonB family protein
MQSEPNAIEKRPGPGSYSPKFLIQPEPWLRVFFRNVADLFRPAPPPLWLSSVPGDYWRDALVRRPAPWGRLAGSLGLHILVGAGVYGLNLWWLNQPHIVPDDLTQSRSLDHYEVSEYLPQVTKAEKKPEPPKRRVAQKADPEYAPQEIISVNVNHNSIRQTIVNPINPRMLKLDTPLPNIVAWTAVPSPAPVAPNHALRQIPVTAPPVVPPMEQPVQRNLNALQFPIPPQVVPPAEAPAQRNMAAVNLPNQPEAAVPPTPATAQRPMGDINLAFNTPTVEAPKLPVPEQQAGNGQQSGQAQGQGAVPPAPPVTGGTGKSQAEAMGQLLVLNANPVAPSGPMSVPEGNRSGEFAAGPSGRVGATAKPEIAAGGNSAGGSKDGVNSLPGNVYIAAPPKKVIGDVVVSAPSVPSAPSPRRAIADTPLRDTPPANKIESEVFGDRKSYSMALNMPNLTSATGTSWIIRFAEMNPAPGSTGDGVSAPVALSKVDPAYPASMIHDRIEGVVILYAVIHSDGSVGEVRVLQGVDDTLDENARDALQKWHFRPGTKNGAPVDLEAVIRIPFRAPRGAF